MTEVSRKILWKQVRNSFFTGLLVVAPLVLSLVVLGWTFNQLTSWLPTSYQTPVNRFLAMLVLLATVTWVGWMMRMVVGRQAVLATEAIINRIPVLSQTYRFFKEISVTVLGANRTVFQRVVLVEYPKAGTYALAFVTSEAGGEVQEVTRSQVVNVFVPTTPNPTSGFLLMVPKEELTELKMTVAEGMKLVISAGALVPPLPTAKRPANTPYPAAPHTGPNPPSAPPPV